MSVRLFITLFLFITVLILLGSAWVAFIFLNPADDGFNNKPDLSIGQNIIVNQPTPYDLVSLPFTVAGRARVFEGTVNYNVIDTNGDILMTGFTTAHASEVNEFGSFTGSIESLIKEPVGDDIVLQVFWESPQDGSRQDLISIPLVINKESNHQVKIYMANSEDCSSVVPLTRYLPISKTPTAQALMLLLRGEFSKAETSQGYFSSLPSGVKLNSLELKGNTVYADFSKNLNNIAGSCRVTSARAQIISTIRTSFPYNPIIISADGNSKEVLQP